MKSLDNPDTLKLLDLLKEYDEILYNHTQVKIISLSEHRRILQERSEIYNRLTEHRKRIFRGG